jgi:hypothetical protein
MRRMIHTDLEAAAIDRHRPCRFTSHQPSAAGDPPLVTMIKGDCHEQRHV